MRRPKDMSAQGGWDCVAQRWYVKFSALLASRCTQGPLLLNTGHGRKTLPRWPRRRDLLGEVVWAPVKDGKTARRWWDGRQIRDANATIQHCGPSIPGSGV